MSRGKYGHRKNNRDAQTLADEIAALTTELNAARDRLAHAEQGASHRAGLDATLRATIAERDAAAAPEHQRLTREIDVLTVVLAQARGHHKAVKAGWESYSGTYIAQLKEDKKSGTEAIEALLALVGDRGAVFDPNANAKRQKLGIEAAVRIDQARGERKPDYTVPTRDRLVDAAAGALVPRVLRPEWDAWIAERERTGTGVDAPEAVKDLLRQWQGATAMALTPAVALAGHPNPGVDTAIDPRHALAGILGLDLSGPGIASPRTEPPPIDQLLTDRAYYALRDPWDVVEELLPAWRTGRDTIRDSGRLPSPLHPSPRHPSPADAVALRHWYGLAAAGAWARNGTGPAGRGFGEAAVALAAAANYWMPPGQVHGYLDSEPITAEDRANLRMAYPSVLLALGKPMVLEPLAGAASVDVESLERANLTFLNGRDLSNARNWLLSTVTDVNGVNVLDLIAARGARVEGILLLADDEGAATGRFAWCLAVPGRTGVLGRWVLPAHRDRTAYGEQIDNLMAVAAWADWHEPADPAIATSTHSRTAALQRAAARGRVHVLNAARTSSAAARSNPTGRTVTAHIRRGHWRHQPVGPGRAQIRMVRIAPAIVGAGNLAKAAPVYRLPTNPEAT